MSFQDTQLEGLPLVDTAPGSPVYDLLAAVRDEDNDAMSRSIWSDFRAELIPRLEALRELGMEGQELKNELHAIRGTSSQFGLFLLETFLFAWEKKEPDPSGAKARYLPGAIAMARVSLDAVERDFPHLLQATETAGPIRPPDSPDSAG